MSEGDGLSCFVDRVDGGVAVLLIGDGADTLRVPSTSLPPGVGEGRWLRLRLTPDPEMDVERGDALRALRRRLLGSGDASET